MKACGYIRVSTEEQSREGVSLDMQRAKIIAYCDLHDLELVHILGDEGISGKTVKGRPGIRTVLELVRTRKVQALVIYKIDRLARNAREALEIAELLRRYGAELHSITEKLDTASASGRLFYSILSAMAQWERETIAERTTAALQRLREKGMKTGGDCPYGFQVIEGRLGEHPGEQAVIRRILELKDQGHSSREIAEALTREGRFTRAGTPWTHTQVLRVLKRLRKAA